MTTLTRTSAAGLTAADAEWFDEVAAGKSASAEGCGDPVHAAQLAAEAAGIEAL